MREPTNIAGNTAIEEVLVANFDIVNGKRLRIS
jgi:hypothetical protein